MSRTVRRLLLLVASLMLIAPALTLAAEAAMSHPVTDVKQFRRSRLGDDFGHELSGYRTVRRTGRNCDRLWRCKPPLHFCAAVITMATISA